MARQTSTHSAQAGRSGEQARSDCWVTITLTDSGGVNLHLKSRVESMYGESTRELVLKELDALGVAKAKVEIDDSGALPFVITARVECAVRRLSGSAGVSTGSGVARAQARGSLPDESAGATAVSAVPEYLPDFAAGTQHATERDRFRRSRLYLPGNEPKFMLNAGLHGPDGVILDLEDSVAPAEKDAARLLVRNALRSVDFKDAERMVRINQGDRGLDDLEFVVPHNVHVILIPKVESLEQVQQVDARIQEILTAAQGAAGLGPRDVNQGAAGLGPRDSAEPVYLMPIVESALGAIKAYEIATSSPNIVALTIGLEDYTADIGTERTDQGRESFWARCQVVNAARAAGVQPIDTVFSDVADIDGLRESTLEAKALGFDGKGCIHPRQIAVIHEAFTPTEGELERAQQIVAAFEDAQKKGLAAVSLGSKMIDPPVLKRAQRMVRLAKTMGMVE